MSNNCKVVDQTTFELLQQSTSKSLSSSSGHKVRNAKYKRMSASGGYDLLKHMKEKGTQDGQNKHKNRQNRKTIRSDIKKPFQKKGKQRENGKKQSCSKLKRAILRYRQNKSQDGQIGLEESTAKLQNMTVASGGDCLEEGTANQQDIDVASAESSDNTQLIHSRRFREYCNTSSTPDLRKYTEELLRNLNFYQRRTFSQNEIKARGHRRFLVGFRQVQTYLKTNKVRLVIVATDCEKSEGEEGGLDQTIATIKTLCQNQNVPIAFPFERRELAYILFKKASISCVGILDYDGARETFAQLLLAINEARQSYEERIKKFPISLP